MNPLQFFALMKPLALLAQKQFAIPASFTIAQAALETGWGRHVPGNNLFGIKADASWKGATQTLASGEQIKGQLVTQESKFRAYSNWAESVEDHSRLLKNDSRYANAFTTPMLSGAEFAEKIAEDGYATDASYASKIASIISLHDLAKLDVQPETTAPAALSPELPKLVGVTPTVVINDAPSGDKI